MAFRYPVGATVVANRHIDGFIPKGSLGTIRVENDFEAASGWVGVEWADRFSRMHNLDGMSEPFHGWYVSDRYLDLVSENTVDVDLDEDDLEAILFG